MKRHKTSVLVGVYSYFTFAPSHLSFYGSVSMLSVWLCKKFLPWLSSSFLTHRRNYHGLFYNFVITHCSLARCWKQVFSKNKKVELVKHIVLVCESIHSTLRCSKNLHWRSCLRSTRCCCCSCIICLYPRLCVWN